MMPRFTPRAKSVRRVNAVGSYGFYNFGDDLFEDTVRRCGDRLWPGARVRTFVPRTPLYSSINYLASALRLTTATIGLLWSDTIAYCGGSILQDVRGVARVRQRVLTRRRVEMLGVSVGPFHSDEAAARVKAAMRGVSRLVVRDSASQERLQGLFPDAPISSLLGGDLVALSEQVGPSTESGDTITVCPSAASMPDVNRLIAHIKEAVAYVGKRFDRVPAVRLLALSCSPGSDDVALCRLVADGLADSGWDISVETYEELGLKNTCSVLASSSMVLSQRLHGAIVAYLSDVPFLLVGHHAKCVDFGSDIGADPRTIVSSTESWLGGIAALLDGTGPTVPASSYRSRAHSVYFRSSSDRPGN